MFASSGDIIPPCGVPFSGYVIVPLVILIGAFNILFKMNIKCLSRIPIAHICFISLEWFTLSKKPLISNSIT